MDEYKISTEKGSEFLNDDIMYSDLSGLEFGINKIIIKNN